MTSLSSAQNHVLNNSSNEYENDNVISYRHSQNYSNRETILCDLQLQQRKNAENVTNNNSHGPEIFLNYTNLPATMSPSSSATIERTSSLKQNKNIGAFHQRTQSLDQSGKKISTGAIKKIPENLKLRPNNSGNDDKLNNNANDTNTSVSSGPYIPISECFTGSPVIFVSYFNRLET